MQRTFLQEKSVNRQQDNAEKSLNVGLSAKSRLIPYSAVASMLSLNNLYNEERDACENYRMIFTVNPICTNVLYNAITEPVRLEGSDSVINLVQTPVQSNSQIFPEGTMNTRVNINQAQAIKDTEYSHERIGNFKYHCGYDIFNNHLLRSMEFEHAHLSQDNRNVFNTIEDYSVDFSGNVVTRVIGENDGPFYGKPTTVNARSKVRMYALDTIKTMNMSFYDGLRVVDGWYGFYNSGYIDIPNGKIKNKEIFLNRILNNEKSCGFIDLYPDRTLYSFIPKPNRFRKRLERNWDCTIVYPFKNDYDTFNRVMIGFSGTNEEWEVWKNNKDNQKNMPNSVLVISTKIVYDNVGNESIQMHSLLRHTLSPGDKVRLFYCDDTNDLKRYTVPVTVIGVGDENGANTNRFFKIRHSDIETFCEISEDIETGVKKLVSKEEKKDIKFFYKKIENGYDNKYYFRVFKELRNYQYVQTDEEYTGNDLVYLTREPLMVTDESPKHIMLNGIHFERISKQLDYTQNKLAYAGNIYGDRVAQVIFEDDICISGLKDNIGRPLSSVYFMVAKTNRGHKEWYEDGNLNAETVEYSHCFGDLTSGLDLPSGVSDYNVRKLHNVFKNSLNKTDYSAGLAIIMSDAPIGEYHGTPMPLETGITLFDNEEKRDEPYVFLGDIIEFNKVSFTETVIEKVYHRFNTAQRECLKNDKYFDINYDELSGDIYDIEENS